MANPPDPRGSIRLLSVFRVSLREQLRSPWDLVMVLGLAPLFLWMYWSFVGGGSTFYDVLVVNQDRGSCPGGDPAGTCAAQAIQQMEQLTYESGTPLLRITLLPDRAEAERRLRDRAADALVVFTADFTASIQAGQPIGETQVLFVGDLNNPYYSPAAIMANAALEGYIRQATARADPVRIAEEPLAGSTIRTEFEIYVPGLIISAGTLMLFSIAIAVTRQIESGAVRRLRLTRVTAFEFLGGLSLLYVSISLVAVLLAFATAGALGFHSQGPLWLAMLICAITGLSVVGVGLITACVSGTVARAAIIANFPLFLLLFFSGAVFPIPNPSLFSLGGRAIGLFDLLPQTQATSALNKVLSLGAGAGETSFELIALAALSALYFGAGVWLFQRIHLRPK